MPLYWLCYRHNNQISVVIEPGASLIDARLRASLGDLDQGEFTEGHQLDRKTEKRIRAQRVLCSICRGARPVIDDFLIKGQRKRRSKR
jgi:hypothetical protein